MNVQTPALFGVTRNGDTYALTAFDIPADLEGSDDEIFLDSSADARQGLPAPVARNLALMLISASDADHSPVGEVPAAENFLDNLELEMANETVKDEVSVQRDLQNMIAIRLLEAVFTQGSAEADESEVEAVAYWLNRQTHMLRQSELPEEVSLFVEYACQVTSNSLLTAAL